VPLLPSVVAMEGLFRHHAHTAGVPFDALFRPVGQSPDVGAAAVKHYQRHLLLAEVLAACAAAGVAKVLLVKGAAVAGLYAAPALREMSDVDFVVARSDSARIARALSACGWRCEGPVWQHRSGWMLDLLSPDTPRARRVWECAEPLGDGTIAHFPTRAHQILIAALHTAKHGGTRLWRDIADVQALLENGARADDAHEAIAEAMRFGDDATVAGLFRFMNRHCRMKPPLPGKARRWTSDDELAADQLKAFYEEMAVERLPPMAFDFLGSLRQSPLALAARVASVVATRPRAASAAPRTESGQAPPRTEMRGLNQAAPRPLEAAAPAPLPAPHERDPVMGDAPATGWGRARLKARLWLRVLASGQWVRYGMLLRWRARARTVGKTFTPLDARDDL